VRYAPGRSFPAYAYLPGRDAHPTRDPRGHSFGCPEEASSYLPREAWRENEDYLFGVDLYNHGYLWEAHEAWEGLWHAARHDALQASHLQGLIQCAAACLKVRMNQPRGLTRLAALGTSRLESVAREHDGPFMGVNLVSWIREMRAFAASEPDSPEGRPTLDLGGG